MFGIFCMFLEIVYSSIKISSMASYLYQKCSLFVKFEHQIKLLLELCLNALRFSRNTCYPFKNNIFNICTTFKQKYVTDSSKNSSHGILYFIAFLFQHEILLLFTSRFFSIYQPTDSMFRISQHFSSTKQFVKRIECRNIFEIPYILLKLILHIAIGYCLLILRILPFEHILTP